MSVVSLDVFGPMVGSLKMCDSVLFMDMLEIWRWSSICFGREGSLCETAETLSE
jgi:hypothetical protein